MSNSRHHWTKQLKDIEAAMAKCHECGDVLPPDLAAKRKELRRRLSRLDRVEEHRRLTRLKVRPVDGRAAAR